MYEPNTCNRPPGSRNLQTVRDDIGLHFISSACFDWAECMRVSSLSDLRVVLAAQVDELPWEGGLACPERQKEILKERGYYPILKFYGSFSIVCYFLLVEDAYLLELEAWMMEGLFVVLASTSSLGSIGQLYQVVWSIVILVARFAPSRGLGTFPWVLLECFAFFACPYEEEVKIFPISWSAVRIDLRVVMQLRR